MQRLVGGVRGAGGSMILGLLGKGVKGLDATNKKRTKAYY
jgi:hypothetical protein